MVKKEKSVFLMFLIFIILLIFAIISASFYFLKNEKQTDEIKPTQIISTLENNISINEAKNIALGHCNQQNNQNIIFTSQILEFDDGKEIYELEFNDGINEYDYDIMANSGEIVKYSVESLQNER